MSDCRPYKKIIKKEGEKKYRSIFENSIVGFFQSTPEGQFVEVNPALAGFLGYSSPEDLISNISDISTQFYANSEDRKHYQTILQQNGRVDGFEFKARCKNGSAKWLSESTIAYFNPDGTPSKYEGVLSDINDKKIAEQKLKESEAQHRSIIRTAMDGFWLMDDTGQLLEVNQTYCRMSGYTEEELLSMNVSDLEAFQTEDEIKSLVQRLPAQKEDRFESQHRRKDGTVFDTEISIQYWSGKKKQFVVFIRDITGRRQAEEVLLEQERLEGVLEMAGAICHELNQPLQTVLGFSELLLLDIESSNPLYKPVKGIETGITRISQLMRRIMGITRYQSKPYLKSKIVDIEKASKKDG